MLATTVKYQQDAPVSTSSMVALVQDVPPLISTTPTNTNTTTTTPTIPWMSPRVFPTRTNHTESDIPSHNAPYLRVHLQRQHIQECFEYTEEGGGDWRSSDTAEHDSDTAALQLHGMVQLDANQAANRIRPFLSASTTPIPRIGHLLTVDIRLRVLFRFHPQQSSEFPCVLGSRSSVLHEEEQRLWALDIGGAATPWGSAAVSNSTTGPSPRFQRTVVASTPGKHFSLERSNNNNNNNNNEVCRWAKGTFPQIPIGSTEALQLLQDRLVPALVDAPTKEEGSSSSDAPSPSTIGLSFSFHLPRNLPPSTKLEFVPQSTEERSSDVPLTRNQESGIFYQVHLCLKWMDGAKTHVAFPIYKTNRYLYNHPEPTLVSIHSEPSSPPPSPFQRESVFMQTFVPLVLSTKPQQMFGLLAYMRKSNPIRCTMRPSQAFYYLDQPVGFHLRVENQTWNQNIYSLRCTLHQRVEIQCEQEQVAEGRIQESFCTQVGQFTLTNQSLQSLQSVQDGQLPLFPLVPGQSAEYSVEVEARCPTRPPSPTTAMTPTTTTSFDSLVSSTQLVNTTNRPFHPSRSNSSLAARSRIASAISLHNIGSSNSTVSSVTANLRAQTQVSYTLDISACLNGSWTEVMTKVPLVLVQRR